MIRDLEEMKDQAIQIFEKAFQAEKANASCRGNPPGVFPENKKTRKTRRPVWLK